MIEQISTQYGIQAVGRPTFDDALAYLRAVKRTFSDKLEIYDGFLQILHDHRHSRIDTAIVVSEIKELFKGYPQLILGINTFLPIGWEVTLTPEDAQPYDEISVGSYSGAENYGPSGVSDSSDDEISSVNAMYRRDCKKPRLE
ncbi:paired amphipathic helix protein Sin3-like 3 [Silene latifolia]|uniref:paired amphipathic helix protein Sin3-like 3 n=1 Tax=Silene latifolia TaxID=37657 RepID=UPI003D76E6E6